MTKKHTILTAINSKYIHSNLAVYCLRAYAKPYIDEVEIAEYTINQQVDDILMSLYQKHPDILCFSCYIWNIEYIERVIREIHKLLPDVPIWLGGPEVSYDSREVLRRLPQVTGVMKGEGEVTFLEVLDHYHGKRDDLSKIPGLTYRNEDEIVETPWRPVMDLSKVHLCMNILKILNIRSSTMNQAGAVHFHVVIVYLRSINACASEIFLLSKRNYSFS